MGSIEVGILRPMANGHPEIGFEALGHYMVGITLALFSHTPPDLKQHATDVIAICRNDS